MCLLKGKITFIKKRANTLQKVWKMDNLVAAAATILHSQKAMLEAFKWSNQWKQKSSKFLRNGKSD